RPRLVNMYGITETTVHVTYRPMGRADAESGAGSRIGGPIPDLSVHVLDRLGQPVPIGVAGELYVGGEGVAAGYLERPALTAERFVPDGWGGRSGQRLYRSGDLVLWRATGELEYRGRIDHQVKVRGFRIELGEIESTLARHPGVGEAAVLMREDGGDHRLVAYVTGAEGAAPRVEELRDYLKERLPEYMVPAAFVALAALPLTPNGKLDRRALPAPGAARPELGDGYVAPRTPAEEALCGIWAQVLGIDEVGVQDNFFALGGDSILSLRVVAMAEKLGLPIALPDLFRHQTVRELAQLLEETGGAAAGRTEPPQRTAAFDLVAPADRALLPADMEDAYPLAMLQAGMLFHMISVPEDPSYHNVDSWQVRGRFEVAAFEEAVRRVVARHPVLRTSFDLTRYSEPLQLVHVHAVLPIEVMDVRHLGVAEQEAAIDRLIAAENRRLFDFSRPPQLRFHIHLRSADTFQFTVTENHAIFDGWSLHSTLAEIFELHLELLGGGAAAARPPLALTYRDYIHLERQALHSPAAEAFWERTLADLPPAELPRWHAPRPAERPRMRNLPVHVPAAVFDGLRTLARTAAVPFKSVLLAAHFKVMALLAGRSEAVSGVVTNGRMEEIEGEQVRGLFLNSLPLRLRLPEGTWIDLVRAALRAEEEMLPFRRYPFAVLQRRWSDRPLFEVNFNYIHFHVVQDLIRSGQLEVLGFRRIAGANFKITANFAQNLEETRVELELEYDSQEISRELVAAIGGYFERVLGAMAAGPAAAHSISFLADEERHQLLFEMNDSRSPDTPGVWKRSVPEGFDEQVERHPQRVAVVAGDRRLDFGELGRRVERLARHLRTLGVGPEVRVGLCAGRSPEMVAGLLAILKAGGAYVPLDPAYPRERMAFMVEDAGVTVLLTERRRLGSLPSGIGRIVLLDEPEWPAEEVEVTPGGVLPDSLAYVIYTSGSTGRPKGVMVQHRALMNYLGWCLESYRVGAGEGAPVHSSIGFDLTVTSLLAPLLAGRAVTLLPEGDEVSSLAEALRRQPDYSLVKLTPSHLRGLNQLLPLAGEAGGTRFLIVGGEALFADDIAVWSRARDVSIVNEYGPTETVVGCAVYKAPREMPQGAPVPIGRPIANARLHVMSQDFALVPRGVAGELCIGGCGVARGYLGRPELTAERFVPDPFAAEAAEAGDPGSRLYRTGDLARLLPDGNLEFLGR
ncbi:MAG TPA: amino acid adenylation domain-containing protein, partial [Thermoanaerobaculia bacterium]|nr:amino acid adenylation domain-containing protein [Thermoanaerobaculia bacterium]